MAEKYTELLEELNKKQAEMMVVHLLLKNDKLYLPVQSDVENIALETLDDDRRIYIYFDPIPLTDNLYLEYDNSDCGWEIKKYTNINKSWRNKFWDSKIGVKLVNSSLWFHIYYKHRRDFKDTCKTIKKEQKSFVEKALKRMRLSKEEQPK